MTMNLKCPDCGKEFEIEESQQAHEKQAAALSSRGKGAHRDTKTA